MINFDSEPTSKRGTGSSKQESAKDMLVEMVKGTRRRPAHSDQICDTFDSEEDQVEYELRYRPPYRDTRFFKTNPAGYNVVRALGAFFALGGWVATVFVAMLFSELNGLAGVIAVIAGLIVGMTLGFTLPEIIWRGVGAEARGILRPLGWFGGLPMLFVCLMAASVVAGGVRIIFPQKPPAAQQQTSVPTKAAPRAPIVWQGSNWRVILDSRGQPIEPTRQKAQAACTSLGPDWRLPTASDAAFLSKNLSESHWISMFYVDGPGVTLEGHGPNLQRPYFRHDRLGGWVVDYISDEWKFKVLCIRR